MYFDSTAGNTITRSIEFPKILPVLHNLKYSMVQQQQYLSPIFQTCSAVSFSIRDPEAVYSASFVLDDRTHNNLSGCAVGLSSVVSEKQIEDLSRKGASFISTMHTSSQLIRAAKHFSIPLLCGVSSERDFQIAISSKVDAIKIYPSRSVPPQTLLKYINEVSQQAYRIPPIIVAGSVTTADFIPYILAGADNFIIGFDLSTASVEFILSELKKLNNCLELARKTAPSITTTAISRR